MEEAANNGISNLPDSLEALHINTEEAANDRISNLPDSLLHHIISFLQIKNVARTSVLSKRWNYIWTTVPTLDFQIRAFKLTSLKQENEKFMDFVDGTLHRHSGNVDKFALNWPQALNESRLHSWVSNVVRCKVTEIVLRVRQRPPLFVPLSLFTCESLISLELSTHYSSGFAFPKYISLPRLKRLKLSAFKFSDESWNGELFSNSPVLEDLVLQSCEFRMSSFCILIPRLKLLCIHVLHGEEIGLDCVFKIDAPRLITFSYSGYVAKQFILSSFPSLVEATVNTDFEGNDGAEEISRLVLAVAHVKCLTVSDKTLQAICSTSYLPNKLLTFHNVKNLNISDHLTTDERLFAMLTAVPKLESLIFSRYMNHEEQEDNDEDNVNDCEEYDENDSEDDEDDNEGNGDEDNEDDNEGDGDEDDEDEGDAAEAPECGSNDECEESEDNYDNHDNSWALDIVAAGCLFSCLKSVCFQEFVGNPRELRWVKLILMNAKALQTMSLRYFDPALRSANTESENEPGIRIPSFPRASAGCVFKVYAWDRRSWRYIKCLL